jgi:hypothetical protein
MTPRLLKEKVMNIKVCALALSSILAVACLATAPAEAKKWTVTQRQQALSMEIDKAFRTNQLTLKEADGLKREVIKITNREQKMRSKNGGKLSYEDDNQLEKDLNDVSVKLHKKQLEKRVQ